MYLPDTGAWLLKRRRVEETEEKQSHQSHEGYKDLRRCRYEPPRKTEIESYHTRAKKVSGLHDLMSRHHRINGEHIQIPVGEISKVEGGKGRQRRPSSSLQYQMDCTVPPEQQRSSNLPDFMCLDPKILISPHQKQRHKRG